MGELAALPVLMSESIAELATALAAAAVELPNPKKGDTAEVPTKAGGKYTYTYADIAAAIAACSPVLARHGLTVPQIITPDSEGLVIVTHLLHTSGQWMRSIFPIGYSGGDPQEYGKLITYFRRYAYLAIIGVAAEDDDAAGAAVGGKAKPARTAPAAPPARPEPPRDAPRAAPAESKAAPTGPMTEREIAAEAGAIVLELSALARDASIPSTHERWSAVVDRMRKLPPPYFVPGKGSAPGSLQVAYREAMEAKRGTESPRSS